jgi:hypothetical protein
MHPRRHLYGAAMSPSDDIVESTKPPMLPGSHDAGRRTSVLLHPIAVASVAAAVLTGITAWQTHKIESTPRPSTAAPTAIPNLTRVFSG